MYQEYGFYTEDGDPFDRDLHRRDEYGGDYEDNEDNEGNYDYGGDDEQDGKDILDSQDDYYEEKYEDQMEAKAFERVGGRVGIDSRSTKELPPEDRFAKYVDAITRKFISNGGNLSEQDLTVMLDSVIFISKIKFLNPTAYILGYLASNRGEKLKKEVVKNVILKDLPRIADSSVTAPDVVRYARYWVKYLKQK